MTDKTPSPRDRLVAAMIKLMREQGVHAAGLSELISRSGAARGSLYTHFPRGKAQLVAEATQVAAAFVNKRMAARADQSSSSQVDTLLSWWEGHLISTDYAEGCPVTAAALSADDSEGAVTAAAQAFSSWADNLATALVREGRERDAADSLARFIISSTGGAVIWARSAHSVVPLADARTHLIALIESCAPPTADE